jgi:hypothetical protein
LFQYSNIPSFSAFGGSAKRNNLPGIRRHQVEKEIKKDRKIRKRLGYTAIVVAGLVLLYAIAGFVAAPAIVKSDHLNLQAGVDEIRINPFLMTLTLRGLEVKDPAGEHLAGLKEVFVDFQLASIFERTFIFRDIHLTGPEGVVSILPDGRLNLVVLLENLPESSNSANNPSSDLPPVLVKRIQIDQGRLKFSDRSRPTPFEAEVFPARLNINAFSTRANSQSSFDFAAETDKGAAIRAKGQVGVTPLTAQGNLLVKGLDTRRLWRYIQDQVNFEITDGHLDMAADFEVGAVDDELRVKLQSGTVGLMDFKLAEKGGAEPLIFVPAFSIAGGKIDLNAKQVSIESVQTGDARFKSWISPEGTIQLANLFIPESSPPRKKSISAKVAPAVDFNLQGWNIHIKDVALENYGIYVEDRGLTPPLPLTFQPINLSVKNLTNQENAKATVAVDLKNDSGGKYEIKGEVGIKPLAARGNLAISGLGARRLWRYVQDQVNFEITDGRLDLGGAYDVSVVDQVFQVTVTDGNLKLSDFKLTEKGHANPLILLPSFSVAGAELDLNRRRVAIQSVTSRDARFQSWLTKEGTFNLVSLLSPPQSADVQKSAIVSAVPIKVDVKDWTLRIADVAIDNYGFMVEDRGLSHPVTMTFQPINVRLNNLTSQAKERTKFAVDVKDDFGGRIVIDGEAGISPLFADYQLKVSQAAIKKLQPYLDDIAKIEVVSGTADVNGRIRYAPTAGDAPQLSYRGALRINDFEVASPLSEGELMKLASFSINGLQADLEPNRLDISEIVIDRLDGSLIVERDGTLNVNRVIASVGSEGTDISQTMLGQLVQYLKFKIEGPLPVKVDTFRVENGAALFADHSISPHFVMEAQNMNGTMTGLSSDSTSLVDVNIEGKIDHSASLKISGQVTPFSQKVYTDINMSLRDFEMVGLSPYAGKYAGYTLEKGRLSLALDYTLEENIVDGDNKILLQRLTLGQRTDSPDAVDLPIELAVALLKDRNGNIKFDLPVHGNIDDPQFSIGSVLGNTMIKFVTGVVTSPFKALDGVMSALNTADLHQVAFEPGSSDLQSAQSKKLDDLAKLLNERPALRVEIKGTADSQADRQVLAEIALEDRLRLLKAREIQDTGGRVPDDIGQLRLSRDERPRLIVEAYRQKFGQAPDVQPGTDDVAAIEKELLEEISVDDTKLRGLARKRATRIKNHLVQGGKVDVKRIDILREKVDAAGQSPVTAVLSLSAG